MALLIRGITAITVTIFLYLIDTDPAYPEFGRTLLEFLIMSGIIYLIFTSFSAVARFLTPHLMRE